MYRSVALCLLLCSNVLAHEMTPTYPKWSVSAIEGVKKTTMTMFNSRKDVQFYEIGVFTKLWEPIPFVTTYKILKVDYLSIVNFDVYIRTRDIEDTEYICSLSKLRENGSNLTMMATKICSRFK